MLVVTVEQQIYSKLTNGLRSYIIVPSNFSHLIGMELVIKETEIGIAGCELTGWEFDAQITDIEELSFVTGFHLISIKVIGLPRYIDRSIDLFTGD